MTGEFYRPVLNYLTHNFQCFSLKEPNMFRVAVQVGDTATLDLDYALFKKSKLSIAIVLITLLQSYDILTWSNFRSYQPMDAALLRSSIQALNLK